MGFNGVRKHQKIEVPALPVLGRPARAPGLGGDAERLPLHASARSSVLTRQWMEAMRRDISHPCIMAWVPFNESWGVPNLPDSLPERHYVRALYHLTKTLDPTRPVVGNDGWESVATDIIGIHDYDDDPERIARRYFTREVAQAVQARAPRRPRAGPRGSLATRAPDRALRVRRHRGAPRRGARLWGYSQCAHARGIRAALPRSARGGALARAAWPASATRSSPTPTRKPTACCTPTARRSSRSRRSPRPLPVRATGTPAADLGPETPIKQSLDVSDVRPDAGIHESAEQREPGEGPGSIHH